MAVSSSTVEVAESISTLDNETSTLSPNTGYRLFSNAAPRPKIKEFCQLWRSGRLKIGTEMVKRIQCLQEKKNLLFYMNN
jgi:hypothetical protein